ncbi:hypothetical protein M8C21_014253, partial [Ambrosia artemisiifolia]
ASSVSLSVVYLSTALSSKTEGTRKRSADDDDGGGFEKEAAMVVVVGCKGGDIKGKAYSRPNNGDDIEGSSVASAIYDASSYNEIRELQEMSEVNMGETEDGASDVIKYLKNNVITSALPMAYAGFQESRLS